MDVFIYICIYNNPHTINAFIKRALQGNEGLFVTVVHTSWYSVQTL